MSSSSSSPPSSPRVSLPVGKGASRVASSRKGKGPAKGSAAAKSRVPPAAAAAAQESTSTEESTSRYNLRRRSVNPPQYDVPAPPPPPKKPKKNTACRKALKKVYCPIAGCLGHTTRLKEHLIKKHNVKTDLTPEQWHEILVEPNLQPQLPQKYLHQYRRQYLSKYPPSTAAQYYAGVRFFCTGNLTYKGWYYRVYKALVTDKKNVKTIRGYLSAARDFLHWLVRHYTMPRDLQEMWTKLYNVTDKLLFRYEKDPARYPLPSPRIEDADDKGQPLSWMSGLL